MSQADDDAVAAWRALLLAQNRVLRRIEADLARAGMIPLTWYDVLLELHGAGGTLRMKDLGERVVLSRTRVSRLVDDLDRAGLVTRRPDDVDGRVTHAVITEQGRRALRSTARAYVKGIEEHFTRHLSPSEQRVIATALGRVVDAHTGAAGP